MAKTLRVYNPEGKIIAVTRDYSYSGAAMGAKTVTSSFYSAQKLDIVPNSYLDFRGERFTVRDEPSVKRTGSSNIGNALQTTVTFTSKQYELVDCDFMDYVLGSDMYYTGMDSFSFYGDVYDLGRRIQANLDAEYGVGKWKVMMPYSDSSDPKPIRDISWAERSLESETKQISPSGENCWNALTRTNSDFGFFFYLNPSVKEIYIGVPYPEFKVGGELVEFSYGKGNGLYEIQRDIEPNTVITRLRAKGSDRNISRDYLRSAGFPRFTQNLQLPSFRQTLNQAHPIDYILAENKLVEYFGIRPGSYTFEDIYPSIEGMVDSEGNPIDTIHAIEAIDDTIHPDGSLEQSYFYVYLYDLGFNINDYLSSEDATLSMKTGYCVTDFKIVEASPLSASEPYYNEGCRWKFRLEKDVTSSANYVLPSGNVKPKKGDKFVLLYILMPEIYVLQAEDRLLEAAEKYLTENSKSKISYTVNLDEIYLANRPLVANAMKEGVSIRVNDDELGDETEDGVRFFTRKSIQNLTITYKKEQIIPSYQITLSEKIIAGRIDRIQDEIDNNKENIINEGTQNTVNRRNGILNSRKLIGLRDKIFDTDGYFDPENIKPNSIETQYLAVGAKSRNFTTNKISIKAYKEGEAYKVALSTGFINHRSLWWGGGDNPPTDVDNFTWAINDALVQPLSENDKDYYLYIKAERGNQLAAWHVTEDKLQFDFDINYYYLLLGVVYPVEEDRRDVSLINGMAFISGGAIYGDVIKSINYVDDESNEGSMYGLNDGTIRIGNKVKGLFFSAVNKVFDLFGVTLEFKNKDDEVVSRIDGDTGEAMFGKGAHVFKPDGSFDLANSDLLYDAVNGMLLRGKFESNKDGNRIVIDPNEERKGLRLVDSMSRTIGAWDFTAEESNGVLSTYPSLALTGYSKNGILPYSSLLIPHGLEVHRKYEDFIINYEFRVGGISITKSDFNGVADPSVSFFMGIDDKGVLKIKTQGMPTSAWMLEPGQWWVDGSGNPHMVL